jgi:zinc protease
MSPAPIHADRPDRFVLPRVGPPAAVRFPPITRERLANGLRIWSIAQTAVPVVTVVLLVNSGSADDSPERSGLAGVAADLLDEGAGGRDAIALAEAFARLGSHLAIDVGADVTSMSLTTLARFFAPALGLLADVVTRPHLDEADLARVRELRCNRLRQLSRSGSTVADRAFLAAVFGGHPYGHGVLGTTRSLDALSLDEVRAFHTRTWAPARATLIVAGAVTGGAVAEAARAAFGHWQGPGAAAGAEALPAVLAGQLAPVIFVDRPGAPQSELRVGHTAPARRTADYHPMVTLNAVLGGQFSSRINQNLRQRRGLTYGARTGFDFRRMAGSFVCETSVAADATAPAALEILGEFDAVRSTRPVTGDELAHAQSSLTRGYVKNFETAEQLARAAAQLSTYALNDDTFDRFVPAVEAVTADDVTSAARQYIRPDRCAIIVVGDGATCRKTLDQIGRPVEELTPEF